MGFYYAVHWQWQQIINRLIIKRTIRKIFWIVKFFYYSWNNTNTFNRMTNGGKAGSINSDVESDPMIGIGGTTDQKDRMFQIMTIDIKKHPILNIGDWNMPASPGLLGSSFVPNKCSVTSPRGNRSRSYSIHCLRRITTRHAPMNINTAINENHQNIGGNHAIQGIDWPGWTPS